MRLRTLHRAAWLAAVIVSIAISPTWAVPGRPSPSSSEASTPTVLHRVVWDQWQKGRGGIHLRSVEPDGSDLRDVYDQKSGFTLALVLSRNGRRVAFSTCCRKRDPEIVVASVLTGHTTEPLAHHKSIYSVGGIGWSPSGSRLAFIGYTLHKHKDRASLWTVRPDGRDLRDVLTLPYQGEQPSYSENELAWTHQGILYSDGKNLRSADHGHSHVVMHDMQEVTISGNGTMIVTVRYLRSGGSSYWSAHPDGSDAHRLFVNGDPGVTDWYDDVIPSYDGSALLAARDYPGAQQGDPDRYDDLTWSTSAQPSSGTPLSFTEGDDQSATWN